MRTPAGVRRCQDPQLHLVDRASRRTQFNLPAEIGDLTFQLCNMGGELVSVEGLSDTLGQPVDPGLLNEPRGSLKLGSASSE